MPKGNLVVHLSDMAGALAKGRVDIDFKRVSGSPGAGGENMEVSVAGPVGRLTVTGIACQTGPGTMYEVRASMDHYRRVRVLSADSGRPRQHRQRRRGVLGQAG